MRSIVPYKMIRSLPYADPAVSLNAGAVPGTATVVIFRANDLFDPNFTGVGHQPRGFDQIMALYDHFVCLGSRIKVNCTLLDTTPGPVKLGITLLDNSTTLNTIAYLESPNTRFITLNDDERRGVLKGKSFNTRKFLGRSHPLSDPDLKGNASAGPSENAFYHIWAAPETSTDAGELALTVKMDYMTAFIEPTIPAQS